MNKKLILLLVLVALFIVSVFLIYTPKDTHQSETNLENNGNVPPTENYRDDDFPMVPMALYPHKEYDSVIDNFDMNLDYNEFMDDIKSGKRNFVWEIWALRKKCPKNYTFDQCNNHILSVIEKKFSSPEKEELKRIFSSYFKYEMEMREIGLEKPQGTFSERYAETKRKRREIFGEEDAKLVFGMEEAKIDFSEAASNFLKEGSKKLTGKEKVEKYNALKREIYGDYYDAMVSREDKFQNYQTEMNFMEEDFKNLSEEERTNRMRAIQIKHFGKEEVERMLAEAKKEEDLRLERENKIKSYETKEQEFLSQNKDLSSEEIEEKLKEIRVEMLGEEEAENYILKKNLEKHTK